jgi:hypothetical protein
LHQEKLEMPAGVKFTLDTHQHVKKLVNVPWPASADKWPLRTKTERPETKVGSCAQVLLNRGDVLPALVHGGKYNSSTTVNDAVDGGVMPPHDPEWDVTATTMFLMTVNFLSFLFGRARYTVGGKTIRKRKQAKMLRPVSGWLQFAEYQEAKPLTKPDPSPPGWTEGDEGCPDEDRPMYKPRAGCGEGPSKEARRKMGYATGRAELPATITFRDLLWNLFSAFFISTILQRIIDCTNAKATEKVIRVPKTNGKTGHDIRLPRNAHDHPELPRKPRCARWKTLTMGTFLVFLGVSIRLGLLNPKRSSWVWNTDDSGIHDPVIAGAMFANTYQDVLSHLSFEKPGSTAYPNDPLRKIRWLMDQMNGRLQSMHDPTQVVVVDESMIKCFSRMCGFTQVMERKPIKNGIKVFSLCLSDNYLYKFVPYAGSRWGGGAGYVSRLIEEQLLDVFFDNKNHILVCDAYFSSTRMFKRLAKRGIRALGMFNGAKPEKATADSWPHRDRKGNDFRINGRGWSKVSYQHLGAGISMMAMTWRDNKFVKMLSTVFLKKERSNVKRWVADERGRIDVECRYSLLMYQALMGAVDGFDRLISMFNVNLGTCALRFQRLIFFWMLSAVMVNIYVLFKTTNMAEELMRKANNGTMGFVHFFQRELAAAVINKGQELEATEEEAELLAEAKVEAGVKARAEMGLAIPVVQISLLDNDEEGGGEEKAEGGSGKKRKKKKKKKHSPAAAAAAAATAAKENNGTAPRPRRTSTPGAALKRGRGARTPGSGRSTGGKQGRGEGEGITPAKLRQLKSLQAKFAGDIFAEKKTGNGRGERPSCSLAHCCVVATYSPAHSLAHSPNHLLSHSGKHKESKEKGATACALHKVQTREYHP